MKNKWVQFLTFRTHMDELTDIGAYTYILWGVIVFLEGALFFGKMSPWLGLCWASLLLIWMAGKDNREKLKKTFSHGSIFK